MTRDDDFFARWSRRKRAAADPEAAQEPTDTTASAATDTPAAAASADERPLSDAELLEKLGLPDPETLKQGDDFSAFMKAAVPEHLRRRALRRLWRSNPVLAVLDGLNDYDLDEAAGSVPAGTLKTAYQIGRGLIGQATRDVAAKDTAEPPAAALPGTGSGEPDRASGEAAAETTPPEMGTPAEDDPGPEIAAPTRRRMVFRVPQAGNGKELNKKDLA